MVLNEVNGAQKLLDFILALKIINVNLLEEKSRGQESSSEDHECLKKVEMFQSGVKWWINKPTG